MLNNNALPPADQLTIDGQASPVPCATPVKADRALPMAISQDGLELGLEIDVPATRPNSAGGRPAGSRRPRPGWTWYAIGLQVNALDAAAVGVAVGGAAASVGDAEGAGDAGAVGDAVEKVLGATTLIDLRGGPNAPTSAAPPMSAAVSRAAAMANHRMVRGDRSRPNVQPGRLAASAPMA